MPVIGENTFKNVLIGPGKLSEISRNGPQENTKGLFTTVTKGCTPSNFRLLRFLMALLDICSVLRVSNFCCCDFNQQLITVSSFENYHFDTFSSEGKRHDAVMLAESNLVPSLEHKAISRLASDVYIYGDLAYPLRVNLMTTFRGAALTAQMVAFNCNESEYAQCAYFR